MSIELSLARIVALKTLLEAKDKGQFESSYVFDVASKMHLSERDKSFSAKLVKGVLCYSLPLEIAIHSICEKGTRIKRKVMVALKISAYEICYLGKEKHASVDQGVELVKSISKNAAGLANFILRRIDENCLPKEESLALGFSSEMARFLEKEMGEDEALEFMRKSCLEPKLSFETNFNVFGVEELQQGQDAAEIVKSAKGGKVIIADDAAIEIAKSFANRAIKANEAPKILEVGAGRGTKTALIQSFFANKGASFGEYDVLDSSERRLLQLKSRIKGSALKVDGIINADASTFRFADDQESHLYDAIFIDAPCSGLGTLRRHPEIKTRFNVREIHEFAKIDLAILKNISTFLKRKGFIYYSTCTITKEENICVINEFLSGTLGKGFALEEIVSDAKLTEQRDAHFCVCLKKL
jgi:16S rRNA (cytosine967-C5)-methyltransferase